MPDVSCLYCGSRGVTWFDQRHECWRVKQVRAGTRERPRIKTLADGRTLITLDPEAAVCNELGIAWYRPNGLDVDTTPVHTAPEPVHISADVDNVDTQPVHIDDFVDTSEPDVDRASQRKAYKAAWMKRRREH